MFKRVRSFLRVSPTLLGMPLVVGATAIACVSEAYGSEVDPILDQVRQYSDANRPRRQQAQVTSVSQLSDVDPTHWAFSALQSLVERYGCIEGYPDRTYRGNRAITRYEFAAGLNACLNRIQELIAAATQDLPSQDDVATMRRLQQEFAPELAALRGRIDALEARAATLEAQQFSTTTKLQGSVDFLARQSFAGEDILNQSNNSQIDANSQTVLQYNARLDFISSFSGKDRLRVRLQAANTSSLFRNISPTVFDEPLTSDEGVFDEEAEELIVEEEEEEELEIPEEAEPLVERFINLVAERDNLIDQGLDVSSPQVEAIDNQLEELDAQIDAIINGEQLAAANQNSGENQNRNASSNGNSSGNQNRTERRRRDRNAVRLRLLDYRFPIGRNFQVNIFATGGRHSLYTDKITQNRTNPLYSIGESGAGIGINYRLNNAVRLDLGYIAGQPNLPTSEKGLFEGNYSALAQLVIQPTRNFKFGFTYINTYNTTNRFRFGGGGSYLSTLLRTDKVQTPIATNSFGFATSYRVSPRFIMGGWVSYTAVDLLTSGNADIWNYALTFSLPDLGKKGNEAVFTVGVDTTLTGIFDTGISIPDRDNVLFVDASYQYKVSDRITITPSVQWRPSLAQNFDNDDVVIGTIRTNFSF